MAEFLLTLKHYAVEVIPSLAAAYLYTVLF